MRTVWVSFDTIGRDCLEAAADAGAEIVGIVTLPGPIDPNRSGQCSFDEVAARHDAALIETNDVNALETLNPLRKLEPDLGALLDRRLGRDVDEFAFLAHLEVVDRHARLALEEEAALGKGLDLGQASRAGADQVRNDVLLELHAERLHPALRVLRKVAELALHVDRCRVRGEDDAVPCTGRALLREDLARPVGHVLPRHLDEAER